MDNLKLLLKLKALIEHERASCSNAKGVKYSKKVVKLTQQVLTETSFKRGKINTTTGLSHDFLRRCFSSIKPVSKFREVKINAGFSAFKSENLDVETSNGLKIKNISLEKLVKLEKLLSCC